MNIADYAVQVYGRPRCLNLRHRGVSQYTTGETRTRGRGVKMGTGFTGAGAV
jgi:hypothetical protein